MSAKIFALQLIGEGGWAIYHNTSCSNWTLLSSDQETTKVVSSRIRSPDPYVAMQLVLIQRYYYLSTQSFLHNMPHSPIHTQINASERNLGFSILPEDT